MAGQIGGWRILVNIFMPIPLVLTFLLIIPFPRNVRKGILIFTHRTLSFSMIGGMKLVHFSMIASGLPLADSIRRTYVANERYQEIDLRPETKMQLLGKKWREERNFWIAAMGFTLWCLLSVLYAQVTRQVRLEEENDELKDTIADLKGEPRPSAQKAAAGQSRFGVSSLRRSGRAAAAKDE